MPEWWQQYHVEIERYGGEGLRLLLVLVLGWLGLRYLVGGLRRLLERARVDPTVASFLASSVQTLLLIALLVVALQIVGVPAATLLTVLGAAGLAIALSLQNSLANFAAGLLVLAFRMVRLEDLIEVGEFKGQVAEMQPFHIVLLTADHQRITVPNTLLMAGGVRNNSALPTRRVQWNFPLAGPEDLAAVKEALRARVQADPRVLPEPPVYVFVQEWAPDKRVVAVQAWTATADYPAVQQDLLEPLGQALERLRPPAAGPAPPG
jgi:small conductance mechanosensitive channel